MEQTTLILRGDLQKFRAIQALKDYRPDPDHPWQVTFQPYQPQKTASQRGLWHAILREMGNEAGMDPDDMKAVVKEKLMGLHHITLPDGREIDVLPSSEQEKRHGYSKLIDGTLRLASEWLGLVIVDPRR